MNHNRQQQRDAAINTISTHLTQHERVNLKDLTGPTGMSRAALIDLMRELQTRGIVALTDQRATYRAGPRLRSRPCTDLDLQRTLRRAIHERPIERGYWTDLLLAEHLQLPRDVVQQALVTLSLQSVIQDGYIGDLMIIRPAA